MAKIEPRMFNLIPYAYALARWYELPPEEREDLFPGRYVPRRFAGHPEEAEALRVYLLTPHRPEGACPRCGWPRGQHGFVRLPFPLGHELFARAICCPDCWAYPFGRAAGIVQSDSARDIAELWERSRLLVAQEVLV